MSSTDWFVVLTKPKQEQRAKEHLELQGGEVFLPMFSHEKVIRGRLTHKTEPLFPGYLFLKCAEDSALLGKVRSTRGVRSLLMFAATPVRVQEALIDDLKLRTSMQDETPLFSIGQAVQIQSGPFKAYQALFQSYDGEERAVILLNILGSQQELLIELSSLR